MVDSLPSNVGTGTVKGTFTTAIKGTSGAPISQPVSGKVVFTPSPAALLDAGASTPQTILPSPISIDLDASGSFSVELVATNDTDLNPSGWTYTVSFKFTGVAYQSFSIDVPEGSTTDLAIVAPVGSANGVIITRGVGVPDTDGADSGDVVTWTGSTTAWAAPTGGGSSTLGGLSDVDVSGATNGQALVYDGSDWSAGTVSGGGAVDSVNNQTGAVVLDAADVGALPETTSIPTTPGDIGAATAAQGATADSAVQPGDLSPYAKTADVPDSADDVGAVPTSRSVNGHTLTGNITLDAGDVSALPDSTAIPSTPGDIGAATAAQGATADTATQPGDLATVATSGSYSDLTSQPAIPSSPGDIGAATAAQGSTADTAVQPGDLADVATSGDYDDLTNAGAKTIVLGPSDPIPASTPANSVIVRTAS
ncbi:MAG: hypothetical protein ACRDP4_08025 [Nocardioidaceae bacterium]